MTFVFEDELNLSLGLSTATRNHGARRAGGAGSKVFSCNFCTRKFFSSQALGGHQNAHKRERGAARKFQNQMGVLRPHSILHKPTTGAVVGAGAGGGGSTTIATLGEAVGSRLGWVGDWGLEDVMDVMWPGSFYLEDCHPRPTPTQFHYPLLDLNLKL